MLKLLLWWEVQQQLHLMWLFKILFEHDTSQMPESDSTERLRDEHRGKLPWGNRTLLIHLLIYYSSCWSYETKLKTRERLSLLLKSIPRGGNISSKTRWIQSWERLQGKHQGRKWINPFHLTLIHSTRRGTHNFVVLATKWTHAYLTL